MSFHSVLEGTNSLTMNEGDRLDTTIYACPAYELSKAVSVSLGLDSVSSPPNNMNQSSSSAFAAECDSTVGDTSRGVSVLVLGDSSLREDDFGEVCQGIQQVSCMDLFGSGEMDGAQTVTRGSVISRYVCRESNVFMNPTLELPATPQVAEVVPLKPPSSYYASSDLYRDFPPQMWCANERAYIERSQPQPQQQPQRGESGEHNYLCKYCNCGQAPRGNRQECRCIWYGRGEKGGKGGMRATAQGYGQMESYPSAIPQGQSTFSTIKSEPSVWMNCTDRIVELALLIPQHSCVPPGKQNHLCASRNDCTIDKLRRKNCASCRLKRCFMSGMSLKGRRLKGTGQASNGEEEQQPASWGHGEKEERAAKKDAVLESRNAAVRAQASQALVAAIPPPLHSCLSLLSILQAIEPALVNAGHDPAQPDSPVSLLTSLNELGERQLVTVVHWAKAIPGFRDLYVDDQMSLIQLSWMGVMVFALGWRSYTLTNSSMLYFAPDLVFNDQRMQVSSMYEHCVRMKLLSQRLCMLKVTQEEFLCMKALVLLSIMPVQGLKSQSCFDKLRTSYIKELDRLASHHGETTRTQRLFQLTQLLDYLQSVVRKLHQFTYDLFIQAQSMQMHVSFPEMISEIVSVHVPKILSGMVKPILFHNAA
uniref:Glucocorticoid receptor-like n=1 Tax=Pundamilia nyererei TaxID=303518 RepID=A0A3B4EP00_9CICH